ncbi:probable CHD1-transcriptional regulator [Serendipita indica DSM 11827]|uniref:Probable CHD1-transcriptional regulator n=1 Tax=Serendipita indica (strain DSM 11827) TaxID=1109443 RepID=G4T8P3_SERID|nr:probable CHD1-transcriptional regulator [Serendipita indica DSM 11827]
MRSKDTRHLMQSRRPPVTSDSDDMDEDRAERSDDSAVEVVKASRTKRNVALPTTMHPAPLHSPKKKRVPRQHRPINQACGVVTQATTVEEDDPLQRHRTACVTCGNPPAHLRFEMIKAKGEAAVAQNMDALERTGGWLQVRTHPVSSSPQFTPYQCVHCTEASHWKCLSVTERSEILRAARARELSLDKNQAERQTIRFDETVTYVCSACSQGGICFECHKELKPGNTVEQSESIPTEILFRCTWCRRAAHYAHLQSPWVAETSEDPLLIDDIALHYQSEYSWRCGNCAIYSSTPDKILAWRPYPKNAPLLTPEEEASKPYKEPWPREYLVKWVGKSYRRTTWVPHLWLASTSYGKLRHFILHGSKVKLEHLYNANTGEIHRRVYEEEDGPPLPNPRAGECIPEAWKQVEQVLDVVFLTPHKRSRREKSKKSIRMQVVGDSDESAGDGEDEASIRAKLEILRERSRKQGTQLLGPDVTESPLARRKRRNGLNLTMEDIDDVVWCYVKWGDLEYQEATWDTPPKRGEAGWKEFKDAFERYVHSQSVFVAKVSHAELVKRDSRNAKEFANNKMEIKDSFVAEQGKHLRQFQIDGVNWLLYAWWRLQPAILADEMGLGKTVQIITFLAKLVEKKIWPHLVVVPNSTILNWMREFQTWAPQLRAVAYYGEAASRDVTREYEIFHSSVASGQTKLKLHVLVTTYETFLNKVEWATVFRAPSRWEVLVVDEGQRLKNNKSLLFQKLNQIFVGHRVLMTGTPLNNNLRELFNLMNFIDPEKWRDVEDLEREYQSEQLTSGMVSELREKLKMYFLRRTKDILNLPSKHEVIVPVSLSKLQKSIYKSLIESNLTVLSNLVNAGASFKPKGKATQASLRNILMETRKLVQHPYLVEPDLERETKTTEEMNRQLIDASGKLKFLEVMLERLKAKGKRVLLFSQFVVRIFLCLYATWLTRGKIALDIIEDFIVAKGYPFLRLDGDLKGALRQKDIDRFNAPDSEYFIYLLSTRAGGVGVNLATADTVIIFDPDFNPFSDAQAIARAHRFGQKKPVIVFRLMATTGPEKKIMNDGKKKLVLDHVIVQTMEDGEEAEDLESMLLSGAKGLFTEGEDNDIIYTEASVDNLIENAEEAAKPRAPTTESIGTIFEFAQVWESANTEEGDENLDTDFWSTMIAKVQEEKETAAAQEVVASGRGGKRAAKAAVQKYHILLEESPEKAKKAGKGKKSHESDVEYQEPGNGSNREDAISDDDFGAFSNPIEITQEVSSLQANTSEEMRVKVLKREQRERRKAAKLEGRRFAAQLGKSTPELPSMNPSPVIANAHPAPAYRPPFSSQPRPIQPAPSYSFSILDLREPACNMAAVAAIDADIAEREERLARARRTEVSNLPKVSTLSRSANNVSMTYSSSASAKLARGPPKIAIKPSYTQTTHPIASFSGNRYPIPSSSKSSGSQKRPAEGSTNIAPPAKRFNSGAAPAACIMCGMSYHVPAQCRVMDLDLDAMGNLISQLERRSDQQSLVAVEALRHRYLARVQASLNL